MNLKPLSRSLILLPALFTLRAARAATILSLTVTGHATHTPDATIARMTVQAAAPDSAKAQAAVNQAMRRARRAAASIKGLRTTTGAYGVFESGPKPGTWHAQQALTLKFDAPPNAPSSRAVLDLIGRLQQQGIALDQLTATLSRATARRTRARAITDAVHQLQAEAATIATALGERVGGIATLDLNAPGGFRPLIRAPAMAMAAAPQASSGPISVQISLSAKVRLRAPGK